MRYVRAIDSSPKHYTKTYVKTAFYLFAVLQTSNFKKKNLINYTLKKLSIKRNKCFSFFSQPLRHHERYYEKYWI